MNTEQNPGNPPPHPRSTDLQALIDSGLGEILPELINTFLETAPRTIYKAGAALRDSRADDLVHAAHELSGSCSNFGATRLREICQKLESLGRAGSLGKTPELFASLVEEFEHVRRELLARLDQGH